MNVGFYPSSLPPAPFAFSKHPSCIPFLAPFSRAAATQGPLAQPVFSIRSLHHSLFSLLFFYFKTSLESIDRAIRAHHALRGGDIALPKEPLLVRRKRPDDGVQHPAVVEQHHVALGPVVRVNAPRRNARPLQRVHDVAHGLQVVDRRAVSQMDGTDGARVNLQRELARHGVAPGQGEDLDLRGVDGREGGEGQFEVFAEEPEAVGEGLGARHPDVGVGCVFDEGGAGEFLVGGGEKRVHRLAGDEGGGAEGDGGDGVAAVVVVEDGLAAAGGDLHC